MSRSLSIYQVEIDEVGGNKCIPLMNFVEKRGNGCILTSADIPALEAIRDSQDESSSDFSDINDAIDLLNAHGKLRFHVEW